MLARQQRSCTRHGEGVVHQGVEGREKVFNPSILLKIGLWVTLQPKRVHVLEFLHDFLEMSLRHNFLFRGVKEAGVRSDAKGSC